MFGGPGETPETLKTGLQNLERLDRCVVFGFIGIRILPDTDLYTRAVREKVIAPDDPLLEPVFYVSPQVCQDDVVAAIQDSFAERLDRVYPCSEFEQRVAMLHSMGHVGPLWDYILKRRQPSREG